MRNECLSGVFRMHNGGAREPTDELYIPVKYRMSTPEIIVPVIVINVHPYRPLIRDARGRIPRLALITTVN